MTPWRRHDPSGGGMIPEGGGMMPGGGGMMPQEAPR
jgi:hypothetical protein